MKKYELPFAPYCINPIMLTYAVQSDALSITTALGRGAQLNVKPCVVHPYIKDVLTLL